MSDIEKDESQPCVFETFGYPVFKEGLEVSAIPEEESQADSKVHEFDFSAFDEPVRILLKEIGESSALRKTYREYPFLEVAESALLRSAFYFLLGECNEEDQTFDNVLKLLHCAEEDSIYEPFTSTYSFMIQDLREKNPNHISCLEYDLYKEAVSISSNVTGKKVKNGSVNLVLASCRLDLVKLMKAMHLEPSDSILLVTRCA